MLDKLDTEERFAFGANWSNFLKHLNEERISEAEQSLLQSLKLSSLNGRSFLDIGSGSGLFSLAAQRLGAKVTSFDYDKNSVKCTAYLKKKFASSSSEWLVTEGSVLDKDFLKQFDKQDIVYSWGVLHHTGNMYLAFENVSELVKVGGNLFISIYNDQGGASHRWHWIKKKYNRSNLLWKFALTAYTLFRQWTITFIKDFIKYANPFRSWSLYSKNRGMSPYYDLIDWVGGYPFEVAKPEDVFTFFYNKGFELMHLKTCAGGLGCNEFVFKKVR